LNYIIASMKNEIILYQPYENALKLEVRVDEDTVWLPHCNTAQCGAIKGK